jgi:hypothetical protein
MYHHHLLFPLLSQVMKKLFLLLFLAACSAAPDVPSAMKVAESYLDALKEPDFEKADSFYSDAFGNAEDRIGKMQKLNEVLGPVRSYALKDSTVTSPTGEPAVIVLTYEVEHERISSIEKYILRYEEGAYRIISQNVENRY